jgi:hypothetical protein
MVSTSRAGSIADTDAVTLNADAVLTMRGGWLLLLMRPASGLQTLPATSMCAPTLADSSKDYMLLGCFPDGPDSLRNRLHGAPLKDTGMSADRCAAMARAAQPTLTAFAIQGSEW